MSYTFLLCLLYLLDSIPCRYSKISMAYNNTRITASLTNSHPSRGNMANAQDERLISSHGHHRQYGATEDRVVSFDGRDNDRSDSSSTCSSSTVDDVELANGKFLFFQMNLALIDIPITQFRIDTCCISTCSSQS